MALGTDNAWPLIPGIWPSPGGGGGGEEAPAWVPAGAIAAIDFVNDPPRAWTATGGEVAFADFDTILGSSELIPDRAYDPAKVDTGVGYGLGGSSQGKGTFLGDMIDAWNFDFTVLLEHTNEFQLEYTEGTFNTDILYNYSTSVAPGITDSNVGSLKTRDAEGADILGTTGAHKVAFSVSSSLMYGGVDGVAFNDGDVPANTTLDPSTPNQPTDIVFSAASFQRLTIYPIKSEADTLALTA